MSGAFAEDFLVQNFDDIQPGYKGVYGTSGSVGGRWHSFGENGTLPAIQTVRALGKCAVRVLRTNDPGRVLICELNIIPKKKLTWEFEAYIDSGASVALCLENANVMLGGIILNSGPDATTEYWDGEYQRWTQGEAPLPGGTWVRIVLTFDMDKDLYSAVMGDKGNDILFKDKPLNPSFPSLITSLIIAPQVGGPVYLDDFKISDTRP